MKSVKLREKVALDVSVSVPDGYGGHKSVWQEAFQRRAQFIYSRGSEAVDAARLTGRSIFKVKIRSSAETAAITTDWCLRDLRRGDLEKDLPGTVYEIREVDAVTDPRWVYLVIESEGKS